MGQPHETGNTLPNTRNLCPKPCPSGQEKNGCAFFRNVVDKGSFWSLRKGRWRLCCVIKAAKRRPKPSDPHKPHIRVDLTHLFCVCCTAMLKIRGEGVSWATPADAAGLLAWFLRICSSVLEQQCQRFVPSLLRESCSCCKDFQACRWTTNKPLLQRADAAAAAVRHKSCGPITRSITPGFGIGTWPCQR